MRASAQIQAAIELLETIEQERRPADRMMSLYYRSRRYIGSKDKAAISDVVYAVLRKKATFSWIALQVGLSNIARHWVLVYLIENEKSPEDYFLGDNYSPEDLSESEKNAVHKMKQMLGEWPLNNVPEHTQLNLPEWLVPQMKKSLGDAFENEMRVMQDRANLDIRVNTLKSDRDSVQQLIEAEGYMTEKTDYSPLGLSFTQKVALANLDTFQEGLFEVQDQGSQLIALVAGVKPGDKVVDFCAGAGGKSLALAAQMQNKGVLHACDVHTKRLDNLSKRKKRAGVHNIQTHILSSERDKWVKRNAGKMDVVLIDAPCTGTGTWRRSPDARWNLEQQNLLSLQSLQASILDSASRLVKPGGRLIYATCSLLREENEEQIEQFLAEHPDFNTTDLDNVEMLENLDVTNKYQLRTSPAKTGMDGFFVAAMTRNQSDSTS